MEDKDIKKIWSGYNEEMQQNMDITVSTVPEDKSNETKRILRFFAVRRIIEAILFLVFTIFFVTFAIQNYPAMHFVLSGGILSIFYLTGLFGSLGQVVLIFRLDYSSPVTSFQAQLERIKAYGLQTFRLFILQVPFFLAYILVGFKAVFGFDIYTYSENNWVEWNMVLGTLLLIPTIWFYRQLNYKTKKRWVKKIIRNEGRQIDAAIEFLNEIEEFRRDESTNQM